MRRLRCLLVLTLAAAMGAMACAPDWRGPLAAWKHPDALPPFPLLDDAGRAFNLAELRGEPLVMGFVFSRCPVPEACPLTMARLAEVARLAPSLQIVIVTLDPTFDTPAVLAAYRRKHEGLLGRELGAHVRLVTGSQEVVAALASLFNVVALGRGGADIAHPVKVALLDEHLKPVHEWRDNQLDPQDIVNLAAAP